MPSTSSILYLIPTPIGNLEDITLRALRILQQVDEVWCEDRARARILLSHYAIQKPMKVIAQHNEHERLPHYIAMLTQKPQKVAYITAAGTPGISDPGFLLVRYAQAYHLPLEVLPGPTAFVPALVESGLPCDRFVFEGFLPRKGQEKRLALLRDYPQTLIFYESPHRLTKTLAVMAKVFGLDRPAAIARELTKIHHEIRRGSLGELYAYFQSEKPKGEFIILVGGKPH
ncbi:MAG: 16S rRNA (cytidine(1402)-2'-O)-methyltransferase [Bacteroidia bacterium]